MFTGDERGNVIHRARTIKGIHRDQILEFGGLKLFQVFLHAGGLELERTGGLSVAVEFISSRVLKTDVIDVDLMSCGLLDILDRLLNNGKGLQAKEVHLDQSGLLDD